MKPSQLASQLRRIAAAIDNSKQPDRVLVARDLKKVLAVLQPNHGLSIEDPKYWEEVADQLEYTLESAEFMGEGVELVTGQELEKESQDHGYYFSLVVSKSNGEEHFGVQVSFDGDADFAWTGPKDVFEFTNPVFLAKVAKEATDMARSMMGL